MRAEAGDFSSTVGTQTATSTGSYQATSGNLLRLSSGRPPTRLGRWRLTGAGTIAIAGAVNAPGGATSTPAP